MRIAAARMPDSEPLITGSIRIQLHVLREVTHCIVAPTPWAGIGISSVNDTTVMKRALIRFQFKIDRPAFIHICDFSAKGIQVAIHRSVIAEPVMMGTGNHLHAAIPLIRLINRQPDGHNAIKPVKPAKPVTRLKE